MKSTHGLFLFGTSEQLRQFIRDVECELPAGWIRNLKKEEEINAECSMEMYCFSCTEAPNRVPAEIWLSLTEEDGPTLGLSTALSLYSNHLTQEEFEAVMNEFVTILVMPAARNLNLEVVFNPKEPTVFDRMPPKVLDALDRYTHRVNKAGRNCHPNDHARWIHFVVSAYEARADIDYGFVESWFRSNGWNEEDARLLAFCFEDSCMAMTELERRRALTES